MSGSPAAPPARNTDWQSLPEAAVASVLALLPLLSVHQFGRFLCIDTRGAVERVCRTWRAAALADCSVHLTFNALEKEGDAEEAVRLLTARHTRALIVHAYGRVPLPAPAALATSVFPQLRRLELRGPGLLAFSSFLPLCSQLQELVLPSLGKPSAQQLLGLLCYHLSSLPAPLQLPDVRLAARTPPHQQLLAAIRLHARPAQLALRGPSLPVLMACQQLTQLCACSLSVSSNREAHELADAIARQQLPHLASLLLEDRRAPHDINHSVLTTSLPGLERLAALQRLRFKSCLPKEAWACRQLTNLLCWGAATCAKLPPALQCARVELPPALQCTALLRLGLADCYLEGGSFPAAACSALGRLTQLALLSCSEPAVDTPAAKEPPYWTPYRVRSGHGSVSLPPEFSQLSSLRHLCISECVLQRAGLDALCTLTALTALELPDCSLQWLPLGGYLRNLRSLDIPGNDFSVPIPFNALWAADLRTLRIDCRHPGLACSVGLEDWQDLETKLRSFRCLRRLLVEAEGDEDSDALLGMIEGAVGADWGGDESTCHDMPYANEFNRPILEHYDSDSEMEDEGEEEGEGKQKQKHISFYFATNCISIRSPPTLFHETLLAPPGLGNAID